MTALAPTICATAVATGDMRSDYTAVILTVIYEADPTVPVDRLKAGYDHFRIAIT